MATIHSSSSGSIFFSACLVVLFFSNHGYASEEGVDATYTHTVQLSSLLPSSACSLSTKGQGSRSSLEVVHAHGPCSQNKAKAPTLTQILSEDESRVNSIRSRLAFLSSRRNSLKDSQATLPAKYGAALGSGNYIVTVGLGTPKRDLSLIFDTGSDLTWTQCRPCFRFCYRQQQPTFDPSLSTSYSNISCDSPICPQLISATGHDQGCLGSTCLYGIQYGDSSFSVGYFAKEKLTLTPTDSIEGFLFGCGQNNRGLFGSTAGLLGLGRDRLSAVSQTASKYGKYFSYCLPSSPSSTGHLTFGRSGALSSSTLKFTPLLTNKQGPSFYYISITAISVGRRTLPIKKSVFSNSSGTIIDSGTVITRLPPDAYAALRAAFRQQMKSYPAAPPLSILDTCYDFSNYKAVRVPTISFVFAGNARVAIDPSGTLYGGNVSQICLPFAGNRDPGDVAILGNVQQRRLEVAYDVAGGKLGFGPKGCA